ncbi:MAG: UPF0149 family protein [Burkholderiales bacterium]|nr:UPF0149 family protein [Burkholderiales bacterium]
MDYPSYDPNSAVTPLSGDELASLDELLATLPSDGAMTLDGMDGFLTALLVGPVPLSSMKTGDWLPMIWGGDQEPAPAPFASNQKRKRTTVLALRHLRAVQEALSGPPDAWEPIFSIAEVPGTQGDELADATDWCLGFLAATDLAPEAWAPLQSDAEFGPGLATIAMLAGEIEPGGDEDGDADDLDDPHVRDHLSRAVADVALQLWARKSA